MPTPAGKYRSLNASRIVETASQLQRRIEERFPQAGLGQVSGELQQIAREAVVRADRIRRPNIGLRVVIAALIVAILGLVAAVATSVHLNDALFEITEFAQTLEATLGSVVFIGAGILFLVTLEIRIKRHRALQALHELRALAHIVDMHQLTKDPERMVGRGPATLSSPKRTMTAFQLGRYLDYCSELLSLISKIAALYVQEFPDPVALESVDQLESLTNGLTRNIWQKIMILDQTLPPSAPESDPNQPVPTTQWNDTPPAEPAVTIAP